MNFNRRTSTLDLYKILNDLGVHNTKIIRKHQLKDTLKEKKYKNLIINLDDYGGGTHWTFYSPEKNIYFDSYAQLPPFGIPKNAKLASTKKELQDVEGENCGALCCLFAYYINFKTKNEFYKLFKDVYE